LRLVKLALIGVSMLAVAGHYWQQARRLKIIRDLPGQKARAYYENTRDRSERLMALVATLFAVGAVAALVYVFALPTLRGGR
jgi:hypothetical protein